MSNKERQKQQGSKIRHSRENFAEMRDIRSSTQLFPSRNKSRKESRIRTAAAVLSNQDIYHERTKGNISIYPFHTKHLTDFSYCVTMGENYYLSTNRGDYFNPWHKKRTHNQWDGPYRAVKIEDGEMFEKCGIPIGKKVIIIPGETSILIHTQEFIGGLNYVAAEIRGRFTLSYGGLMICNECSWTKIGDIDRKTLVIRNTSKSPAVIPVGAKIAHVIFHYTGLPKFYLKGETQSTGDLEVIVKNWTPENMLPKLPARQFSIGKMRDSDFITRPTDDYDPDKADDPYESGSESSSSEEDSASGKHVEDYEKKVSLD